MPERENTCLSNTYFSLFFASQLHTLYEALRVVGRAGNREGLPLYIGAEKSKEPAAAKTIITWEHYAAGSRCIVLCLVLFLISSSRFFWLPSPLLCCFIVCEWFGRTVAVSERVGLFMAILEERERERESGRERKVRWKKERLVLVVEKGLSLFLQTLRGCVGEGGRSGWYILEAECFIIGGRLTD